MVLLFQVADELSAFPEYLETSLFLKPNPDNPVGIATKAKRHKQ
jgi:hypothetical protein